LLASEAVAAQPPPRIDVVGDAGNGEDNLNPETPVKGISCSLGFYLLKNVITLESFFTKI